MVKTKTKKAPAAKSAPEKTGKKKQPGESQIKKQPFLKRMLFGEEKPDLSELEAGSTTILDILSPTTVDTKSRDYIIVDDVYHAYLYITGYGYTTTVGTCWLAPLVEAGEGINLSFLVKRQPKEKILSKIAQTTMVNRSRMRDVGDTRQDYEELDSAISSGLYLKDVMNRQGENFYYMHTLIEVTASDPETLEQRVTEVEKLCVSSLFFSLTFPQLSNYARLHGGRLPVLTNFCLEEYLNIGYMEGISDVFNSIRGFNMSVQVAVQSLSQWQEKYPGKEWENQLGSFDMTLYMGCNDMTSAEYFAKKCGKVTISVTNNQFPLAPLFSPIYSTTRPYSQTRSNTQRDLLQPDEFLRLNKFLCIVMFNHYKPAQLYKIMLEELPEYKKLKKCSVFDYVPEWKKREEEGAKRRTAGNRTSAAARNTSSAPPAPQPSPASGKRPDMQPQTSLTEEAAASGSSCGNDNMTPEEIGLVEMTCEAILEGDDPELEEMDDPMRIPPGRGI